MARFGGLLVFIGVFSAILHYTDRQLVVLSWSEDMQPVFGIVLALVGVALIVVPLILQKRKAVAPPQAAAPAPAPQQPGQPG